MKQTHGTKLMLGLAGSILLAASAAAQQQQAITSPRTVSSYTVSRETSLSGTVVSFSQGTPRSGALLTLNTSSGVLRANVGNAKLLSLNGLGFDSGESVRLTGENVSSAGATVFAARIVQKGSQSLTVRSERGFMARPTLRNTPAGAIKPGGVM